MTAYKNSVVSILAAAMFGCGSAAAPPDDDAPPLKAGAGIKVDAATSTVSIDDSAVPVTAGCAAGQIVQRLATGWACIAAAPDALLLGGKTASQYLTADSTVANATNLGGHAAAYYLSTTAQAADSAKLNGHGDTDFLPAGATAVNSSALNGHPDGFFLPAAATAANSAALNGHPDTYFLPAAATAANCSLLGGQAPSQYARTDVSTTVQGPFTVNAAGDGSMVLGGTSGGILGKNSGGNLHLDADANGSDGHIYLSWLNGHGVRFGNGNGAAPAQVAEMDTAGHLTVTGLTSEGAISAAGDVSAPSFNGLEVFRKPAVGSLPSGSVSCDSLCDGAPAPFGTCISAKIAGASGSPVFVHTACSSTPPVGFLLQCYCTAF